MADLFAAIVRGDYGEGVRLPREADLAESFRVSRGVVRQSVQALQYRGVVTIKHGVGQVVSQRRDWNLFDPDLLRVMLDGPDALAARREAVECGRLIWPQVARLAAMRRTDEQLQRLELAESPAEFREALTVAAGNRFLGRTLSVLDQAWSPQFRRAGRRAVVEAVRDGDAHLAVFSMEAALGQTEQAAA